MKERKTLNAQLIDVWEEIGNDLQAGHVHDYHARISYDGKFVDVDIISSPGGDSEGGYAATHINAPLPDHSTFQFSITPEDIINRIGKLFGMQDIRIGYPEFDKNVIVKSNDEQKVRQVFADEYVREVFQQLSGFTFGIKKHPELQFDQLELSIQRALTNIDELETVCTAFQKTLDVVYGDKQEA